MIKKAAFTVGLFGTLLAVFQCGRAYEVKYAAPVRMDASEAHVTALMAPGKGMFAESMPEKLARVTRENEMLRKRLSEK